ncbi:2-oxoacid dehydrogenases acyltransferase-domain-containing protein [Mycena rebaudengoi]|nr:2-oxoacid dehydrogenases acyltransferase-domain-containing protein [Mycena rebaudengoi]
MPIISLNRVSVFSDSASKFTSKPNIISKLRIPTAPWSHSTLTCIVGRRQLEWSPITRVTPSQRTVRSELLLAHQAPLLHGGEGDLLPSLPSAPASPDKIPPPCVQRPPLLLAPSSFHAPPPTALAPPPAVFSPRRTTPIPRAGVPPRRVVHRTPPPYAITGTTTTATSVLVQATYNPSSTSYPMTSTSSTAAYPSSAYPTSTYPATTRSSNSAPCSSSRPPPPPPPTTLKAQESTPLPPPPARRLHPLDPAFSGDKRGAAVSDVDTLATPSVRHYVRTQGVDLAQIAPGTGCGGRVERADVDAFLAAGASSSEGSAPSAPRNEKDVLVELGRTRQTMWRAMEKSLEIPHFGYSATLDITELHALLPLLNANIPAHYLPSSTDTSPARLSPAEQSALSLGLPLPTPAIAELAALGRAVPPALTPKHLAGGATLTVSNVGSAGRGRWASPVLVPGGGIAIVALGRAEWVWDVSGEYPRARAEGDSGYGDGYGAFEGQRRLKLNVSWAADHRVVEGAEMAAFVESWRGWVEAPGRALGEGV